MSTNGTVQALSAITDGGLFERLAAAILREANPDYGSLVHPGVNVAGKTVKSPLDGICFIKGANPPHMVAVHHTTTARDDLEKKWLHDPSTVKPRNGTRPTAPAGDLIKTAQLVAEERKRVPNLCATLVLTTNEEPAEALIRTIQAAGDRFGLEIDIWSRSRLSHYLDTPSGQWIRRSFLKIEQEQLSPELLRELSQMSLQINHPPDNPDAWVPRALDSMVTAKLMSDVTFLVAGSGLGKSIACFRQLAAHLNAGGAGFVVPHQIIASAATLELAVEATLRQLHPLAAVATQALSFCSQEKPLLLVVEDVNRSGQTQYLIEKIASWSHKAAKDKEIRSSRWRLICPLWPEVLASLSDQFRKRIDPLILRGGVFSASEGREAVLARARVEGYDLSRFSADAISCSLGHDPLLIALHDQHTAPDLHQVISQFVEGSLSRAASLAKEYPPSDFRQALRALAEEMLARRQLDLRWCEVRVWKGLQGDPLRLLGQIAHLGELIRLTGSSDEQTLSFRHDRVRDWLLVDAASELDHRNLLSEEVVAEPYFAEIMGAVFAWGQPGERYIQRLASGNPLALFHANRLIGNAAGASQEAVVHAIYNWLDNRETHDRSRHHLRREALRMLAETDSSAVPTMVARFHDRTTDGYLARLRNGQLAGGIELCSSIDIGLGAAWLDIHIDHAKVHHGHSLTKDLNEFLMRDDLGSSARSGGLRLAGFFADPTLGPAVEVCWNAHKERNDHLKDYLWAFAQCCGENAEQYLKPVCDAWASLSDQPPEEKWRSSPRSELAAYDLRSAFHRLPPHAAIDYFIQRGGQADLKQPITFLLHVMDNPNAVSFVAQELAAIQRSLEGTESHSPFVMLAKQDWQNAQEYQGRSMSKASRDLLLRLWQDEANEKCLRIQSFNLWAATQASDDIEVLSAVKRQDDLTDKILTELLMRGDQRSIPKLICKLADDDNGYWWQCGRYLWSPELTKALCESMGNRALKAKRLWFESLPLDWIFSEMVSRLPVIEAERLLLEHWEHLRYCRDFVQVAMYVSTKPLMEAVHTVIHECPEPAEMFQHLHYSLGINMIGRPGLISEAQVLALAPYFDLMPASEIESLWEVCNYRGWFTVRRDMLDSYIKKASPGRVWDHQEAMSKFDEMVAERRLTWIDIQIDDFIETGVLWSEILATMTAWLDKKRSLAALEFVAAAIEVRGTRADLCALKLYEGMPGIAKQLILDTEFAVRRRSLQ